MIKKSLLLARLWLAIVVWSILLRIVGAQSIDRTSRVVDGELKACHIISVDQAWAVGERGLILATKDAGKTWISQSERSDSTLHAVIFSNDQTGWALGGTIDPVSHRSVGVVLHTVNGGQTWQSLACRLPRILGAQWIGRDHILAWGDWSNVYQSSLFESMDGGVTWSARPVPSGHLQSAWFGADKSVVLVDRMGKAFRSIDGTTYEPIDIATSPFEPLRFCKYVADHWWLGGDAGQLYRSMDGVRWERLRVPGSAQDHALISFREISGTSHRIGIVSVPGNVVWTSDNSGQTWNVGTQAGSTVTHGISFFNPDVMMTCGPLASIQLSRNGGKAWWTQHQSGSRYAILNIASNSGAIAWDLLTHASLEARRHVAVQVVHEKEFQDRTSYQPELAARVELAAKSVHISECSTLSSFPISNLPVGVRAPDLIHYHPKGLKDPDPESSMVRKLVWGIRAYRPDVLVFQSEDLGNSADRELADTLEFVLSLASQKEFALFSQASGIPNHTWKTKRTMVRTAMPGLSYAPTMLLKSTNQFLAIAMCKILPLASNAPATGVNKASYRVLNHRNPVVKDPLEGIAQDDSTLMYDRPYSTGRLSTTLSVSQLLDWRSNLRNERLNPLVPDRNWESKLKSLVKDLPAATIAPILFQMAIENRRMGEWSRWQTCLDLMLELDPESSWAESAYWELMAYTGSEEVRRILSAQLRQMGDRVDPEQTAATDTLQQSSPFATGRDTSAVQQVAYSTPIRRVRVATKRDLVEFTRLLSRWPNVMYSRRSEPEWAWLIAARYRSLQQHPEMAEGIDISRNVSLFWPSIPEHVAGWQNVASAERELNKLDPRRNDSNKGSITDVTSIRKVGRTPERPYLDGFADEPFWANSYVVSLRDPWSKNSAQTTIRIARDEQFLYLHSLAPRFIKSDSIRSSIRGENRRDSLQVSNDHIKIRIDIDRDYATWFELGWSFADEKLDQCNDMLYWNPDWYAKTTVSDSHWQTEIAIPIEALAGSCALSSTDCSNGVWAINAIRSVPSVGSFSAAPYISDQLRSDEWLHIDMQP